MKGLTTFAVLVSGGTNAPIAAALAGDVETTRQLSALWLSGATAAGIAIPAAAPLLVPATSAQGVVLPEVAKASKRAQRFLRGIF